MSESERWYDGIDRAPLPDTDLRSSQAQDAPAPVKPATMEEHEERLRLLAEDRADILREADRMRAFLARKGLLLEFQDHRDGADAPPVPRAYVGTISLEEADRIADMALGKAPLPEGARRWTMAIEPTPRGLELQARTVEEAPDLGWPSAGHAGECPHCGAEKGIWIDLQRTPSVCTHCGNRSDRELEFPVPAEALSPASRP